MILYPRSLKLAIELLLSKITLFELLNYNRIFMKNQLQRLYKTAGYFPNKSECEPVAVAERISSFSKI